MASGRRYGRHAAPRTAASLRRKLDGFAVANRRATTSIWGVQAGYHLESPLGAGNYRVMLAGGSLVFVDPERRTKARPLGWGLSFDQALGNVVGLFLCLAWQDQRAALDYEALYSGGNFAGRGWERIADNIGIGYRQVLRNLMAKRLALALTSGRSSGNPVTN